VAAQQISWVGVFARNHSVYLEHAAEKDSEQLVTFRSKKTWSGAKNALKEQAHVWIFFAIVGQPGIQYRARLQEVLLQPRADDPETQRLIGFAPPGTVTEGLWDEGVHTLYAISGCHKLEQSFPFSHLNKTHDHTPLSADYKYSYALVEARQTDIRDGASPDTASPPARVEATITRIIRDTALVCRLKALYNDTCQICGLRLELSTGRGYSEGHHLQPLGAPHKGLDIQENIIIVCPNCHALLDRCSLPLSTEKLTVHPQHRLGETYLRFHNDLADVVIRS